MIDFDVEPEFQKQIDWVERFTKDEIEPLDQFMSVGRRKDGSPLDGDSWGCLLYTSPSPRD